MSVQLYLSDPHGEYEAFNHIVKSGCGAIRACIDKALPQQPEEERAALATLIYYPAEKLRLQLAAAPDQAAWLQQAGSQLARVAAQAGAALEEEPASPDAIVRACEAIQRACVSHLHVLGDVYDRGPNPELIMDLLASHHSMDIQWGNHDIVWMGAALGQRGCIAHVVRNCARYGNLDILEDAYGMNLQPLKDFALAAYAEDPCVAFNLKGNPDLSEEDLALNIKVQKAMAILQFKVEAQLIDENPSFGLEDRKLLHRIDHQAGTVVVDGTEYALIDRVFPTVNVPDPYRLTAEEEAVMVHLQEAFKSCLPLQRHMALLLEKGSLYKVCGNNLMFHACVPLNADGTLKQVRLYNETLSGKALFDTVDRLIRAAFDPQADEAEAKRGQDLLWYLWLGQGSPLFAKSKMATFELYLIAEKEARKEVKNPFYSLLEDEDVVGAIFQDFGMDPATSRILCGHVPVKVKDGEDPVKCNGKVVILDGGMSAAYQKTTGIAGFTLIEDGTRTVLATHSPLPPAEKVVSENLDMHPQLREL